MGSRLVLVMVAAVAIVAVGGIGYAAFTSTAYINGNIGAGTVQLAWCNPDYASCAAYFGAVAPATSYETDPGVNNCPTPNVIETNTPEDTLVLSATNLAPGDYCTFTASLENTGNLPVSVTGTGPYNGAGSCGDLVYGDNINGGDLGYTPSSPSISVGGSFGFQASLGLSSSASTQSETCTFDVSFTGTAT
jgi:hypothetical protein